MSSCVAVDEAYPGWMRTWLLVAALLLTACGSVPRDIEGTSERVAAAHIVRVGLAGPVDGDGERFLRGMAQETGARIVRIPGSLEPLVDDLDHGRIDLLVAPIRSDALIAEELALSPPLDGTEPGDHPVAIRAAARNGENRWIMRIEHVARKVAGR